MRSPLAFAVAALWLTPCANAQVTVDLHALDALPGGQSGGRRAEPPRPRPRPKVTLADPATSRPPRPQPPTPEPAPPAVTPATAAPLPIAEPPAPLLAAPPPPPAKPAVANLRLAFPANQADLPPDGSAAIKGLVESAPSSATASFNVIAYAAGAKDDPSTARRVSLARALAVRTALMGNGVASSRITVRALGSQGGDGPPDRVDISTAFSN